MGHSLLLEHLWTANSGQRYAGAWRREHGASYIAIYRPPNDFLPSCPIDSPLESPHAPPSPASSAACCAAVVARQMGLCSFQCSAPCSSEQCHTERHAEQHLCCSTDAAGAELEQRRE